MSLFGKKKKTKVQEDNFEIFGGFTITKKFNGYEILWKSPQVTTIIVNSEPEINKDVQVKRDGDIIQVLSTECNLKITSIEGNITANIFLI